MSMARAEPPGDPGAARIDVCEQPDSTIPVETAADFPKTRKKSRRDKAENSLSIFFPYRACDRSNCFHEPGNRMIEAFGIDGEYNFNHSGDATKNRARSLGSSGAKNDAKR